MCFYNNLSIFTMLFGSWIIYHRFSVSDPRHPGKIRHVGLQNRCGKCWKHQLHCQKKNAWHKRKQPQVKFFFKWNYNTWFGPPKKHPDVEIRLSGASFHLNIGRNWLSNRSQTSTTHWRLHLVSWRSAQAEKDQKSSATMANLRHPANNRWTWKLVGKVYIL